MLLNHASVCALRFVFMALNEEKIAFSYSIRQVSSDRHDTVQLLLNKINAATPIREYRTFV